MKLYMKKGQLADLKDYWRLWKNKDCTQGLCSMDEKELREAGFTRKLPVGKSVLAIKLTIK